MVYSSYTKQRIVYYLTAFGMKPPTIRSKLREEGIRTSRQGIYKFTKLYQQRKTIARKSGSGRPSKVTREVKEIVEEQMRKDDETTARQLHKLLQDKGYNLSLRTIILLRCRTVLGWTFRGSSYCQLIRNGNKQKRLEWAVENTDLDFSDIIWTDESTIQLESHRRFCCRKIGEPPKNKPR